MTHLKKKSSHKPHIRLATAGDYRAVLDINRNVYEGFDYLPSLYFAFVHHPDVLLWVAEVEDKIVGFSGYWLMEGRSTACAIAARVHPDYQGRGIMDDLVKAKKLHLRKLLPHDFHVRATGIYNPKLHFPGETHRNPEIQVVGEWHHMAYYALSPTAVNEKILTVERGLNATPVFFDMQKTTEILQRRETLKLLRRHGPFMPCDALWLPVEINDKNLADLSKNQSKVYFTMDGEECRAVSFCCAILFPHDSTRMDIYYHGDRDVNTLTSHVCAYLRHLAGCARYIKRYHVITHFPMTIDPAAVENALHPLFGKRFSEGFDFETTRTVCTNTRQKIMPIARL